MAAGETNVQDTMRAVRFHAPGDVRVERVPRPRPGPQDVLLRVDAVGICTTDRKIARRGHFKIGPGDAPRILGHEVAGTVVATGREVTAFLPGDRLGMVPNTGCGRCSECVRGASHICEWYDAIGITLDGGMAEYMLVPARYLEDGNAVRLPANVSALHGALLEPMSCCFSGLEACRLQAGESLVVAGGGALGLMTVALGRAMGASPVLLVDPHQNRLERGRRLGADDVLQSRDGEETRDWILQRTGGRGADVVMVAASSAEAAAAAPTWAARQGRVNFFASFPPGHHQVTVDANLIHYKQLQITGTTGSSVRQYRQALALLQAGRIDAALLVTGRRPLSAALEAFEEADSRDHARILLEPASG